ncbi:cell envelope protein [Martelella sp. AD-3]|nr:cell envelope protein [Martelella sp. AD-3]
MMMQTGRLAGKVMLGLAGSLVAFSVQTANAEDWPSIVEAKQIAEEGYVYGLPIVMNYAIMYDYAVDRDSDQFKAPFNEIKNEARVYTYKDTTIISPNSDTPYSVASLDLRAEPVVLSVPAVDKRYYSVQLVDGNTYNFGYIGSRATGSDAGDYMIAGPDWSGKTPEGIKKVFRASTQFSLAIYRTQLFGPDDMPNVEKVQAGYKVQTLSAYAGEPAPAAAPAADFPKVDKDLVKTNFFEYLDFALQFAPASSAETEIRAKLAKIGVGPGKSFQFKDMPLEHRLEVALGMRDGDEKVKAYLADKLYKANGWSISDLWGDAAFVDGDWIKRAAGASAGIYGNDAAEAVYILGRNLANGDLLDGSKQSYTLTFPAGELPPVEAFWSITMYDGKTQLLIENPISRYLINSPMLPELKKNADGSLTLYIQKDTPGAEKESNWLPAPDGPIYLAMRMYWPKTGKPSVLPVGQGTWQPPALETAK